MCSIGSVIDCWSFPSCFFLHTMTESILQSSLVKWTKTQEAILSSKIILLPLLVSSVANTKSTTEMEFNGYWLLRPVHLPLLAIPSCGLEQRAEKRRKDRGSEKTEIHIDRSNWSGVHPCVTWLSKNIYRTKIANILDLILKTTNLFLHNMALFFLIYCPIFHWASDQDFWLCPHTDYNGFGRPNLLWSMRLVSWCIVKNMAVGCRLSQSSAGWYAHRLHPPYSHRSLITGQGL